MWDVSRVDPRGTAVLCVVLGAWVDGPHGHWPAGAVPVLQNVTVGGGGHCGDGWRETSVTLYYE